MKTQLSKQILMLLSFLFLSLNTCMAESKSQWKNMNREVNKKDCLNCYADLNLENKASDNKASNEKETVYVFNDDVKSESKTYSNNGYTYTLSESDSTKKSLEFNDKVYLKKKPKSYIKKSYSDKTVAIQVGAFRYYKGAQKYVKKYAILSSKYKVTIKTGAKNQKTLYRVRIEGFSSRTKAKEFKKKYGLVGAFLVMK